MLDLLSPLGLHATYTGSLRSGTMSNPENEGHGGYEISPLSSAASSYLRTIPCPHLALLHIGTNDCNDNTDVPGAGARLGALLDSFASICPDMPVIVAQIISSGYAPTQTKIEQFNPQVPAVVQQRVRTEGRRYLTVDMSRLLGQDDYVDFLHPNDSGYVKMAEAWFGVMMQARARGWI